MNGDFLCFDVSEAKGGGADWLRQGEGFETSLPGVIALNGPEKRCADILN